MTSSPGSMKPIKALSMPSLAPVVIVTSVLGLMSLQRFRVTANKARLYRLEALSPLRLYRE